MKTIRNILILVVVTYTFSCSQNQGKFLITNVSDFDIDSLSILPDSKQEKIGLKKGESVNHNILMDNTNTDGSYSISFRNMQTEKTESIDFGYYTNGYQVEDVIKIRILNDTIITDSKFDNSY